MPMNLSLNLETSQNLKYQTEYNGKALSVWVVMHERCPTQGPNWVGCRVQTGLFYPNWQCLQNGLIYIKITVHVL